MPVDFGKAASDYARYRTEFPRELFTRLAVRGVGLPGDRVVDLGTGTGVLARGFAAAGCKVTGVDIAPEMLAKARQRGAEVTYRIAPAEDTGLPAGSWDVVTAGQSWHWFDGERAATEARRLLTPEGSLVICSRDYVLEPGNVCEASEQLILAYNPAWPLAGGNLAETADLEPAGFNQTETIDFVLEVPFTHEEWRGRMRSSNGIGATLPPPQVKEFDKDLARLLKEQFPEEPLRIKHQIKARILRLKGRGAAAVRG